MKIVGRLYKPPDDFVELRRFERSEKCGGRCPRTIKKIFIKMLLTLEFFVLLNFGNALFQIFNAVALFPGQIRFTEMSVSRSLRINGLT